MGIGGLRGDIAISVNIRQEIHKAVDDLPAHRLPDVEPKEMWLFASGNLKKLVDEMVSAPAPAEDWRKHLPN